MNLDAEIDGKFFLRSRLRDIADVLNCTVEDIVFRGTDRAHIDLIEMLGLWDAIKSDEGRRAVLDLARVIVGAQAG